MKENIRIENNFQFSNIAVRSAPSHKKEVDPTYDITPEKDYEELGFIVSLTSSWAIFENKLFKDIYKSQGVQHFGTMMKKYNKKSRPVKWTKR